MYLGSAIPFCRRLPTHLTRRACDFALANPGNNIAAKIAMMAMTTRSSISVNPERRKYSFSVWAALSPDGFIRLIEPNRSEPANIAIRLLYETFQSQKDAPI